MSPQTPISLFYSYAHDDQAYLAMFKSQLHKLAEQRSVSLDDWYDEDISKGQIWREEIATQIEQRNFMIVLVTTASVSRKEVEREVQAAAAKGKTILPILFNKNLELPDYVKPYQAIKAYDYNNHVEDLYAKVLDSLMNPANGRVASKRNKHNLYVAALGNRGGRTTAILALNQALVDKIDHPGYFKPFHPKKETPRDATFILDVFKLAEVGITPNMVTPFEYGSSAPNCTETQLRDSFERVARSRRPVMIEGSLYYIPRNIPLRTLICDILDARLLLVIDHKALDNPEKPPTELLDQLCDNLGDIPSAFLFNRVPKEGLSDSAQEVRQVALNRGFKELGYIPDEVRLTAIKVRDLAEMAGGQILTDLADTKAADDLIWRFGQVSFADEQAFEFYKQQKIANDDVGRAIFSGASKLGINLRLAKLGYHLFLTGTSSEPDIDQALIDYCAKNAKTLVYFPKDTQQAIDDIKEVFRRGIPFCYPEKVDILRGITGKLDTNLLDAIVKRNNDAGTL